ncbi:19596_t:CDS:1, partial [Racocetra persica]
PKNNDHYASLNEIYGKETTEIHRPSLIINKNKKNSQVKLKNNMPFNGTAQRAKNVGVTVMCSECEHWRLFYSKQKINEQEKKLLTAYLDTIDYSCGSSFYNAENLFGLQNQQLINNKLENNTEIESDSELVITESELKNKKRISNEIELSNSENNSDYDNLLLNQNE